MDVVSSLIPKVFGQVKDIEESYDEVEDFKNWCNENQKVYILKYEDYELKLAAEL